MAAMRAVAEREKEEGTTAATPAPEAAPAAAAAPATTTDASADDATSPSPDATATPALEEGEIAPVVTPEQALLAKQMATMRAAAEERAARKRMLGNIAFVGQLYKNKLLTEKIMHNCITTLLQDLVNPRSEDVECLCKLMVTVGGTVRDYLNCINRS